MGEKLKTEKKNRKDKLFCLSVMIITFIIFYVFSHNLESMGIELFVGYSVSIASAAALLSGFASVIRCLRKG